MKVSTARMIDVLAGIPLCAVLRVLRALSPWRRRANTPGTALPRRILVIKCFGFGSILEMCPMLAALKEAMPGVHITLLTFAENAAIVRMIPMIDEAAVVEFRRGFLRFTWDSLKSLRALRRNPPDAILDCEFFSCYTAILAHLACRATTMVIGFYRNGWSRDWMFTHMIAVDGSQHISRLFFKMLAPLGIQASYRTLAECGIAPGMASRERMAKLFDELQVDRDDLCVAMNINSSDLCLNRRWPKASFARLIQALLAVPTYGERLHILLIGGREDAAYVGDLCRGTASPRVHDLAGRTTIEELAALFQRADLFVGNDSGPLHLAVACGVRTVSFFGPETPTLYGPQSGRHRVLYSEQHCSPCLNLFYFKETHCANNVCMQAIAPETAFAAIDATLREISPSGG